jgi:hypothetical protein
MARRAFQVGQGPGIVAIRRHCPSRAECAGRAVPGPAAGRPGDPGAGGRRVAGERQRYRPWCGLALHDRGRPIKLRDLLPVFRTDKLLGVPCGRESFRPVVGLSGVASVLSAKTTSARFTSCLHGRHRRSPRVSAGPEELHPVVAAALGVVGDGDLWPRQGGELLVEGGWVGWPSRAAGGRRA